MPDSVEMPAPVSTLIALDSSIQLRTRAIRRSRSVLLICANVTRRAWTPQGRPAPTWGCAERPMRVHAALRSTCAARRNRSAASGGADIAWAAAGGTRHDDQHLRNWARPERSELRTPVAGLVPRAVR